MLVSDDLFLKELAANEWGVKGVASFDVLAYAAEDGRVGRGVFEAAAVQMIRWKFRGMPIRVATILFALKRSLYEIDESVRALLEVLADEETDTASAVGVAVGVLRDVWLSAVLPQRVRVFTDALFGALVRERGPAMLDQVKARVSVSMRLVPQYERAIVREVDEFRERRYRGEIVL